MEGIKIQTPFVEQIFTGKVQVVGNPNAKELMEKQWQSGMFKNRVHGKIKLEALGLVGDEVADTKNHGGAEKAIFAYPADHYSFWEHKYPGKNIVIGAMGENLAVRHMDEHSVCIGDTYQFGEAVIQVSQPRQPCWKPARRFKIIDFALQIQKTGRTGWYFRVLQEGVVHENSALTLLERPYPEWTIAKCNEVMHERKNDMQLAQQLAACSLLAPNWKETLQKRIEGKHSSAEKRIYGPNKQ